MGIRREEPADLRGVFGPGVAGPLQDLAAEAAGANDDDAVTFDGRAAAHEGGVGHLYSVPVGGGGGPPSHRLLRVPQVAAVSVSGNHLIVFGRHFLVLLGICEVPGGFVDTLRRVGLRLTRDLLGLLRAGMAQRPAVPPARAGGLL